MWRLMVCMILLWAVFVRYASADDSKSNNVESHIWRVAVIDRFYPSVNHATDNSIHHRALHGLLDLDNDELPEPYYHGDLVQIIASDPRLLFIQYPIFDNSPPLKEILARLLQIRISYERFPIDALLLSWESSTLVSAFEKPLRPENVKLYKSLVREWGEQDSIWYATSQIILQLEWLAKQGVLVFTIAGNGGAGMVNTFSFAEGVTTVGASEPELKHFVAHNAFVDLKAPAAYQPKRLDALDGRVLGYDVNGDDCVDIPLDQLSSFETLEHREYSYRPWPILKGSSFAAPAALKARLLGASATDCL